MKILVTGPYGFVGSQIVAELINNGYEVIGCAKNIKFAKRIFPQLTMIHSDFNNDLTPNSWIPRLKDIDVVINCVGLLTGTSAEMWRIHYEAPRALFEACQVSNVKKIIQISALGVDKSEVLFAQTKKAADDILKSIEVSSVVIRPSLVYGSGSFGGTSLFRGLAGLPGFIPIPAKKEAVLQPIHIKDLAQAVVNIIKIKSSEKYKIVNAVGSERYTLFKIILLMRQWLGFGKARKIKVPVSIIKGFAKLGDWLKLTFNSTLYQMSHTNNVATLEETQQFSQILGHQPKDFQEGLTLQPSYVQDRWHARLYFLRPALRLSIGFLWFYTGIISLIGYPHALSFMLLKKVGIESYQALVLYSASLVDIVLGIFTFLGKKIPLVGSIQIILILIYTLIITVKIPEFWLHPFAPIAKNIPLLIATMIMIGMESKR